MINPESDFTEELAPIVDRVIQASELFPGEQTNGRPRAEWALALFAETEQEIETKCRDLVYMSWRNQSDGRSDYHWRAEALRWVCKERGLDFYDTARRQIFGY